MIDHPDMLQFIKFAAALLFVLALMGALALAARRFAPGAALPAPRKRRLSIVEVLPLDPRRKAVLIRHDDREHLVILGANAETVIESGRESRQDAEVIPFSTDMSAPKAHDR